MPFLRTYLQFRLVDRFLCTVAQPTRTCEMMCLLGFVYTAPVYVVNTDSSRKTQLYP